MSSATSRGWFYRIYQLGNEVFELALELNKKTALSRRLLAADN
jgi:hypothetical protein